MNATDSPEVREFKEHYPEYFTAKRSTAIQEVQKDRTKTNDELLVDIHDESLASEDERSAEITVARTIARFAALVSNISVQGEKTSKRNLQIAHIALFISILAACISVIQLWLSWKVESNKTPIIPESGQTADHSNPSTIVPNLILPSGPQKTGASQ